MAFYDPVTLTDGDVTLAPLGPEHADDLRAALDEGGTSDLWFALSPSAEGLDADIAARNDLLAQQRMVPFAVLRAGRAVGMTTYLNPLPAIPATEIGATWYAPCLRRTGLNTTCKLLLLTHAFETWGCRRVAFRATWFNDPSRQAIERLGATFEGRIRNDRVLRNGIVTDTAQYAITDDQWPAIRAHLHHLRAR